MWETASNLTSINLPAAVIAGAAAAVSVGILFYARTRLPRDRRILLFQFYMLGILGWALFDLMVRLSATPDTAMFWRGLLRVGQLFCVPVGLHFALAMTRWDRSKVGVTSLVVAYAQGLAMLGLYQNGVIVEQLNYVEHWGYLANTADFDALTLTLVNIGGVVAITTTGILTWHAVRCWQQDDANARAMALMASSHLFCTLTALFTELVLPNLGVHQIPITGAISVVFGLATVVAIARYDLFAVSPEAAVHTLLQTIRDPVFLARADGQLLLANPAALHTFGLAPTDLGQHRLFDLVAGEDDEASFRRAWRTATDGTLQEGHATVLRTPDREVPYLVSLGRVPAKQHPEPIVAVVAQSVEELVDARRRAEAASASKSLFLANMSHELRTPLNAIIGYAELLQDEAEEDTAQDLDRIQQSGRHLLGLINDILDLAKVESGKMQVHIEAFSLEALIAEAQPAIDLLVAQNANRWHCDLPSDAPLLLADRDRTRQVLMNLVSNASKFTDTGDVGLRVRGGSRIEIDIWDSGIGMNDAQVARLFDKFSQVHETRNSAYGGTGLGLALSQQLCELMEGEIRVESQEGEGSTFTVSLPAG